ncbi:Spindle pole body component alp6 [Neofusicoccum parvum]|uniref:Spindle pole body component alp6 n=1 Tax=Neofusicoccum parvum TaxID=310453 RepID=A0ACB5S816_9PEZI|nr:Spindle pole body component alp6 [Neofusicoccum parvum]
MPQTTEERVEHALGKLLEHLLPQYPDEDEDTADQRFDDAFNYALGAIDRQDSPICTPGLVRENSSPEKALRFTNLYSRLLTQPVLNQKWAMLYFLFQLSDSDIPVLPPGVRSPPRSPEHVANYQPFAEPDAMSPSRSSETTARRGIASCPSVNSGQTEDGR